MKQVRYVNVLFDSFRKATRKKAEIGQNAQNCSFSEHELLLARNIGRKVIDDWL